MDNCEPTTQGGNHNLTNGNEQELLDHCVQIATRTEGQQDGEFH